MRAKDIDESNKGVGIVDMLAALPPEEREYYSAEAHVVIPGAVDAVLFSELQERFGCVGGVCDEYCKYFACPDLPPRLWSFVDESKVKAIAGFSAVAKKVQGSQRKLLIHCSTNFAKDPG